MKEEKINPLLHRRQKLQKQFLNNNVHHRRYAEAMKDFEKTADFLSQEIARFITEKEDDIIPNHVEFRKIMYRIFIKVLKMAAERAEPVFLLDDETVPGFSVMLFKKTNYTPVEKKEINEQDKHEEPQSIELKAASIIVSKFVERTGNSVITIETDDVVFIFFPSSDLKKNLDELGLSIS